MQGYPEPEFLLDVACPSPGIFDGKIQDGYGAVREDGSSDGGGIGIAGK